MASVLPEELLAGEELAYLADEPPRAARTTPIPKSSTRASAMQSA